MNLEKIEKSINEAFENKAKLDSSSLDVTRLVKSYLEIFHVLICKKILCLKKISLG